MLPNATSSSASTKKGELETSVMSAAVPKGDRTNQSAEPRRLFACSARSQRARFGQIAVSILVWNWCYLGGRPTSRADDVILYVDRHGFAVCDPFPDHLEGKSDRIGPRLRFCPTIGHDSGQLGNFAEPSLVVFALNFDREHRLSRSRIQTLSETVSF